MTGHKKPMHMDGLQKRSGVYTNCWRWLRLDQSRYAVTRHIYVKYTDVYNLARMVINVGI